MLALIAIAVHAFELALEVTNLTLVRVQLATREGLLVAQPLVLSKQPCMFSTHTLKVKEFGLESLLVRCVCGEFLLELR